MRTIRAMVLLRKLQFSVDVKMGPERLDSKGQPFKGVVFGDVLRRLNCLSRLQDINFGIEFDFLTITNFDVNDADMETIATAWPNLHNLTIVQTSWGFDLSDPLACGIRISRPSLSAMVSLAERCRKLEEFCVEFEDVKLAEVERLEARAEACTEPQTTLRRIVIESLSDFCLMLLVDDPDRLAIVLRRLFPNLSGGVGPQLEPLPGEPVRFLNWQTDDIECDAFHLLAALDGIQLDALWEE